MADPADEPADLETDTVRDVAEVAPVNPDVVTVTITKFGAGKVSTGQHVAGEGDIYADRGETLTVAVKVAERLEKLGFAEAN